MHPLGQGNTAMSVLLFKRPWSGPHPVALFPTGPRGCAHPNLPFPFQITNSKFPEPWNSLPKQPISEPLFQVCSPEGKPSCRCVPICLGLRGWTELGPAGWVATHVNVRVFPEPDRAWITKGRRLHLSPCCSPGSRYTIKHLHASLKMSQDLWNPDSWGKWFVGWTNMQWMEPEHTKKRNLG